MNNIVIGRREDGSTVYYTGRAGQAFVSAERAEAFQYDTLEGALRRAANLNQGTLLHGIRFIAPNPDPTCAQCGAYSCEHGEGELQPNHTFVDRPRYNKHGERVAGVR